MENAMQNKTFNQFYARTDVVVIGQNPEMADYDNPRGDLYGFASYVIAANDYGDTREFRVASSISEREALEPAEQLADALNARFENFGKPPVGFSNWQPGRAVYGSDAYLDYGQADDVALEALENDY